MTEKTSVAFYVRALTVENIRCFREKQELDFLDAKGEIARWTVILGENGVGKTTLLKSLLSVEPYYNENSGYFGPMAMSPSLPLLKDFFFLAESGRNSFVQARFTKLLEKSNEEVGCTLEADGPGWIFSACPSENVSNIPFHPCIAYGASRKTGSSSIAQEHGDNDAVNLLVEQHILPNPESWLLQADYAASRATSKKSKAKKRLTLIRELLSRLLPDVEDLRIVFDEESGLEPGVEFETPYGWVRFADLSLGYRTMVSWMVDLARRLVQRYPESENPLAEPAVVLIDELDLHMHPRWQRDIMDHLSECFPKVQFIVTAHSPLIAQAREDVNFVVLRRNGDSVEILNDVPSIRGWRVDQVLSSDLFALESVRPPYLQKWLDERKRLLGKSRLSKADRARLTELEEKIGELPTAERAKDQEAMDLIHRAAEALRKKAAS